MVTRRRKVGGDIMAEVNARLKALESKQEERLARHRSEQFHLPYVHVVTFPLDGSVLRLIPREEAKRAATILFYKKGKDVRLAVVNPSQTGWQDIRDALVEKLGLKIQVYVMSHHSLQSALGRYPKETGPVLARDKMVITREQLASFEDQLKMMEDLGERVASVSPTEILSTIVAGALNMRASDIHIEPRQKEARLRYRVDGVLQDITSFGLEGWRQVLSRVKVLSQMKLNVSDLPQDGSFVLEVDGQRVDVRVSVLPGGRGEYIVLRLLGRADAALKLSKLGMKKRDYEAVLQELKQSTGMVLAAGPTGSGKTTTIASALNEVNRPELKVISLEDPIEYRLEGVEQTAVDVDSGYTFAVGLRSILRQDPDIIFVGEMRDEETAMTAMHAATTGHLVFSTVHTNDAPGVVLRAVSLGIEPYILAPALNLVIAQRLVRIVCKDCAEAYSPDQKMRAHIAEVMEEVSPEVFDPSILKKKSLKLYRAKGCAKCGPSGYSGRTGVYEVMPIKGEVEELISQGADGQLIRAAAQAAGMTTIAQDAYLKTLEGITTVEEIRRISEE